MTSSPSKSDLSDFASRVNERFLVPRSSGDMFPGLSAARASLPPKFSDLGEAFERNLSAVLSTVGMPVTLASASASGSHWQRIHTAERILARLLEAEPGEDTSSLETRRNRAAQQHAEEKMREFLSSSEGRDTMATDSCRFLLESLSSSELSAAAAELLLQGEVLAWSALEILARDLFEAIINAKPELVLTIIQNPIARQRLPSKLTLEELANSHFDISTSLGSVLCSQQDFSDLRTIRAVLVPALNSDADATTALADHGLWILCQRRHVIVHRRGIVDTRYLDATGAKLPVGSRLAINPNELESDIKRAGAAGTALLSAVGKLSH